MTGDISRRMTADTSNYENAIKWINFSAGTTIAAIGYHNTVQKIYLNPVGASEIYNDAVGKYSLVIGNNELTYNTKTIIHSGNIGSQSVNYASSAGAVAWGNVSSKPSQLFCYKGEVSAAYVNGTTYSTLDSGTYYISYSGYTDSLIHFQHGGSSSGLDIKFNYNQAVDSPLYYRKTIDSNRFASTSWVALIDSLNIGSQSVSYATSAGSASSAGYATSAGSATNDSDGNAINSTYLKKSGGTMTGAITCKANQYYGDSAYGINMNNSDLIGCNSIRTMDLSDDYTEGLLFARTNGNWDSFRAADSNFYFQYNNGNSMMQMNTDGIYLYTGWLRTYGDTGWYSQTYGGGWYMQDSTWIRSYGGKYVYVDSYFQGVHVWAGSGSGTDSNYALHVNGVGYFSSGVYSDGYVSALSDARHKEIVANTKLTVEQIANMRSVLFRWNDGKHDNGLYVGSIAQDWEKVLPQVVSIEDNTEQTRSLQYGVAALVAAITTARKVVDHEKRITELEKENKELREEICRLKIA